MLLKCFNCTKCDKPFDCKEGAPNSPIIESTECAECGPGANHVALMKFLDQPAFTKTDEGYVCSGEVMIPTCVQCKYKQSGTTRPVYANCGHVTCNECSTEEQVCWECGAKIEITYWFDPLLDFFDELAEQAIAEEAAGKNDRTCTDCNISRPVERLFSCIDCATLICGVCQFHQHRQHNINPLLGIELTKLKTGAGERYNDKLSGLQKNLKFLHKEVEESIAKVIAVGTKRLKEVDDQETFVAAKKIATEVDVASEEFEQYCEQYIPVARVFNENLTKLSEKLNGPAKD